MKGITKIERKKEKKKKKKKIEKKKKEERSKQKHERNKRGILLTKKIREMKNRNRQYNICNCRQERDWAAKKQIQKNSWQRIMNLIKYKSRLAKPDGGRTLKTEQSVAKSVRV